MPDDLLQRLGDAVGAAHVLRRDAGDDVLLYERDWRKRFHGRALAVVRPGTTSEVSAVLRLCHEAGCAVVPQGGNTGLVGGGVPDESGRQVVLQMGRMNRIREVDVANLTLTAEAGCILQHVQEAAAAHGLLLPLSLGAEGTCMLGGNLATNAGGTQVLRYGNARDLCLGLEVVTPSGDVWQGLTGLRKDNTGYDLRDLYVGSEGTLGIITAAVMSLHPAPVARLTAMAGCPALRDCVALLDLARHRAGPLLTGFEVMNALSREIVARQFPQVAQPLPIGPWTVLIELSDAESEAHARALLEPLLADALDAGVVSDAVVASSLAQARAMWHLRESIPLAQAQEGLNIKHDIALPVSAVSAFVQQADAAVLRVAPGARCVNFGHLGDGNLHYNIQAPPGATSDAFLLAHEASVNRVVYDLVHALGGSISAEHGIGQLKREHLAQTKSPVALGLMRAIKTALDPRQLMNPGRLLP